MLVEFGERMTRDAILNGLRSGTAVCLAVCKPLKSSRPSKTKLESERAARAGTADCLGKGTLDRRALGY